MDCSELGNAIYSFFPTALVMA